MKEYTKEFEGVTYTFTESDLYTPFSQGLIKLKEDIAEAKKRMGVRYIKEVEDDLNIEYDIVQIEAIKNSVLNNFSILTGGPGTGKTTIILAVIKIFQKI